MSGHIRYTVIVRGERQGLLRRSRHCEQVVTIVSGATREETAVKAILNEAPWSGIWRTLDVETTSHDGGLARVEIVLPDLPLYPVGTPVPYRLNLLVSGNEITRFRGTSQSITMDSDGRSDIKLSLLRTVTVRAGNSEASSITTMRSYSPSPATPQFNANKGGWERCLSFEGTLRLSGSPTLTARYLSVSYSLKMRATIPGRDDISSAEWPITLCSATEVPPPAFEYAYSDLDISSSPPFTHVPS